MAVPSLDPDFDEPEPSPFAEFAFGWSEWEPIAEMARDLIDSDRVHFARLSDLDIRYAIRKAKMPSTAIEIDTAAKFVKAPPLWHDLTGIDAVIWVASWAWEMFNERQRQALVAHELNHADVDEDGKLSARPHDVEDFAWVVRRFGAWDPKLRRFAEQLRLFEAEPAATPRVLHPLGEQVTGAMSAGLAGEPVPAGVRRAADRFRRQVEAGETDVSITTPDRSVTIPAKGKRRP